MDVEKEIRKCRKKLRQIDRLMQLDRELNDEELKKILQTESLRRELQDLVSQLGEDTLNSTQTTNTTTSTLWDTGLSSPDTDKNTSADFNNELNEEEGSKYDEDVRSPENITLNVAKASDKKQTVDNRRKETSVQPDVTSVKGETSVKKKEERASQNKATVIESNTRKDVKAQDVKPQPTKEKKSKSNEKKDTLNVKAFQCQDLAGHNDLVTALHSDGEHAMSGSRDTMVKVWHLASASEIHSLGGHTATVSSVRILTNSASQKICSAETDLEVQLDPNEKVGLSGSHDCFIKLWGLVSGQLIRKIYTFNSITAVHYIDDQNVIVSTSDGGKVQLWSPLDGSLIYELVAHDEAITSLQVVDSLIYTACEAGEIVCFEYVEETKKLRQLFRSENLRHRYGGEVITRPVHSLASVSNSIMYYGDDGVNVKALNWNHGEVHKLSNHRTDFGGTHCVSTTTRHLFSTAYDLYSGEGYINVRPLQSEEYICTLRWPDLGRIVRMSTSVRSCQPQSAGDCAAIFKTCDLDLSNVCLLVSTMKQLLLLTPLTSSSRQDRCCIIWAGLDPFQVSPSVHYPTTDAIVVPVERFPELASVVTDSEAESSDEEDNLSDSWGTSRPGNKTSPYTRQDSAENGGWLSWCTLV